MITRRYLINRVKKAVAADLQLRSIPKIRFVVTHNIALIGWYDYVTDTIYLVKSIPKEWIPETIAHELRHVWQIRNGLLEFCDGVAYWKGMPYSYDFIQDPVNYIFLPWEVDAEDYAVSVAMSYIK